EGLAKEPSYAARIQDLLGDPLPADWQNEAKRRQSYERVRWAATEAYEAVEHIWPLGCVNRSNGLSQRVEAAIWTIAALDKAWHEHMQHHEDDPVDWELLLGSDYIGDTVKALLAEWRAIHAAEVEAKLNASQIAA